MNLLRFAFPLIAALVLCALTPAEHGDFDHYTFALTWQPGICQTDEGCAADQPHRPYIGLHGLWASTPHGLLARGIVDPQWWERGCDFYHHSDAPPPIAPALRARVEAVMPRFAQSLPVHEYDKHVQCFGFDPSAFFETELRMRDVIAASSFGAFLRGVAGTTVSHAAVVDAFVRAFHPAQPTALQLQCRNERDGKPALTQFWMTIPTGALAAFPQPRAFMATPTNQDTCPERFLIPAWS